MSGSFTIQDMVINAHAHLDNYDQEGLSISTQISHLRSDMKQHGIHVSAVMVGCHAENLEPGREELLVSLSHEGRKDIYAIAGFSAIRDTKETLQSFEPYVQDGTIRGIKLFCGYEHFYPYDPRLEILFDFCEQFKLPVFVHTGITLFPTAQLEYSRPLHVDRAASEHRHVTFVICHLGYPWLRDAAEIIRKNENVYGDLSGVTDVPIKSKFGKLLVRDLTELHAYMDDNFSKLIFGTDWPLFKTSWYLELIEKIPISDKERELIMYGNAAKLLKLPDQ